MKHVISLFLLLMLVAAGPMAACQVEAVSSDERRPDNVRIDHDITAKNQQILVIFQDVLRGTGLNGGFAEIGGCSDSDLPQGSLKLKLGITVREAMDALVSVNPSLSYQWEWEDGMVNLLPRVDIPLLDTRITNFRMDAMDREIPAVVEDMLRLPEVRAREADLDLREGLGQGELGAYEEHPIPRRPVAVHVDVKDLPLRNAINNIVRAMPKAVWIYHEIDCGADKTYGVQVESELSYW
jgi:hypothetical protein